MNQSEAKRLWQYEPETGKLYWRIAPRKGVSVGAEVRSFDGRYLNVKYKKKKYSVHRVVWLLMCGVWPPKHMDHLNGDMTDNRFSNLRLATARQNSYNRHKRPANKTGYRGVYFAGNGSTRYRARIRVNGKLTDLGYYDDPRNAHAAYCFAACELHGEFVNLERTV